MKTPEEIKRGLECCINSADLYNGCMDCGKKKCNWKWRGVEEEKHET